MLFSDISRLALALPALLLTGCFNDADRVETFRYADPVVALDAATGSGDIHVRTDADATKTSVDAVVYGEATRVEARFEDGRLQLSHTCPKNARQCGVDWRVVLPEATALQQADLDTGSGDILVEDVSADLVVAASGSGDIALRALDAAAVDVESGSGDIEGNMREGIESVVAATGSGDVSLDVPPGSYALDLQTGSGDIARQDITHATDADARVEVSTGSGDIRVRGRN